MKGHQEKGESVMRKLVRCRIGRLAIITIDVVASGTQPLLDFLEACAS